MAERPHRRFLDWTSPALPQAAVWLLNNAEVQSGEANLGDEVAVLPGRRAARALTGLLADEAERRGLALIPPIAVTPGELPASLLGPPGTPASPMSRRLAWIEALRSTDADSLAPLLPKPLAPDDLPGWSRTAAALERASDELAAEGVRFSEVENRAAEALPQEEIERWRALASVQNAAEDRLRRRGLVDEALATRAQVLHGQEPIEVRGRDVTLIGVSQLNLVEREAIARGAGAVNTLIFAPESMKDRFDDLGCARVEKWAQASVDLDEDRVIFTDDPREQAERALALLAERGEPVNADEVVVGAPGAEDLARLRRRAAVTSGVTLRSAAGEPASASPPGRLIALLAEHARERTFDTMSSLIRHPDVEMALLARCATDERSDMTTEWWLSPLNTIRREYVLTDPSAPPASLRDHEKSSLRFVVESLDALLGDLTRPAEQRRPITEWTEAIEAALRAIYDHRELRPETDADRNTTEGLKQIRGALDELMDTPRAEAPTATASQTLGMIEDALERAMIPEPPRRGAIDALGWLELALDPAPRCVVVGMTEARVPGSPAHDPLLPDSLRARLGLATNESRLARDAYLLASITASRDAVFLAPRLDEDSNPQTSSRLLLRTSGRALAERVRRFARPEHEPGPSIVLKSRVQPGGEDRFAPPVRVGDDYQPPTLMSVTDFDAYLRSPAGWYLERCLGLDDFDPPPRELTPMRFGDLAHATLEAFGKDPGARDLEDAEQIKQALCDLLDQQARRALGDRPTAAVRLQKELLRRRFALFAPHEAARRAEGWRIKHVEWKPDVEQRETSLNVDGEPMRLRGKIDRIDEHDELGWAIIDYKTGAEKNAEKAHRKRNGVWTSLQLPLYRHLIQPLDPPEQIALGFAGPPVKESDGAKDVWSFLEFSAEKLEEADERAREIVRDVRAYRPGDEVELGDHPPDAGALGFLTGQRFDLGGRVGGEEAALTEETS